MTSKNFILVLSSVFLASVFSSPLKDEASFVESNHDPFHVVVFDAGSTGTRIYIFKFQKMDGRLQLLKEVFKAVKPGLSHYADHPRQSEAGLADLLQEAVLEIPPSSRSTTPLALRATAGLRLLPASKAEGLLQVVRRFFGASDFHVAPDAVSILDSVEEGYFGWISVNFLLGRGNISDAIDVASTVATLDLGGASTQVTFAPRTSDVIASSPAGFIQKVAVLGEAVTLYSHSYLGLGLIAARLAIMKKENPMWAEWAREPGASPAILRSSCLPADFDGQWASTGGHVFHVGGRSDPGGVACRASVAGAVVAAKVRKIPSAVLDSQTFFAFSYYFDVLEEAALIPSKGGAVEIRSLDRAARAACGAPSVAASA